MSQLFKDNRFPPVINGKISEIYPWTGFIGDHYTFVVYFIKKFFKINTKKLQVDTAIKEFFACKNIYLLDSGRSALFIALKTLLKPGEEVLVSAFNCTAVEEAITQAGMAMRFIDINSKVGLDINSIKNAINPNTKCIIVTHIYGIIDDLEELSKFCQNQDIFLINDLAQTLEDPFCDKKLNLCGDISIYSFGPEKHLFALGGGALVTHNNDLVVQIEKNLPKETALDKQLFLILVERWKYYFTFFSFRRLNYIVPFLKKTKFIYGFSPFKTISLNNQQIEPKLMHPVQQRILVKKIKQYKKYLSKTINNFDIIKLKLKNYLLEGNQSLPLYATIHVDAKLRFNLARYLSECGVQTVWNYLPLYKKDGLISEELMETERLWQEVLSIPFRYPMTDKRINRICEIINMFMHNENPRN